MSAESENNAAPAQPPEVAAEDVTILEWTTHPVKRKPWTAVAVTLFILAVSFVVLAATDSKWFGFIALVVLFASVAKFYLPTKFSLMDKGVVIKSTTQTVKKPWSMFRSYYVDKHGVLLSPFTQPSRLENFRGIYLIFSDNREAVMAVVRDHVARAQDTDEARES